MWNLFLDDERYPVSEDDSWIICRTVDEAMNVIHDLGLPDFMSLDHDLGADQKTGYDFVKEFVNYLIDTGSEWNYKYYVHSQNPIGKNNIIGYIDSYRKSCV